MSKRTFALAAIFLTLAFHPQRKPTRIPRIGILLVSSGPSIWPRLKHFANGCASLAMSKKNILIEYRGNRQIEKTLGGIAKR